MKQYNVTGMTCAACQARVEKAVSKVPGVTSCSVSLLTNSMGVEGAAADEQIIKAVTDAGYGASIRGSESSGSKSEGNQTIAGLEESLKDTTTPKLAKRLVASLVFLLILMYFSMGLTRANAIRSVVDHCVYDKENDKLEIYFFLQK